MIITTRQLLRILIGKFDHALCLLNEINQRSIFIMATFDEKFTEVKNELTAQTTVVAGIITLIQSLRDQIVNGVTDLSAAQIAQVDAVVAQVKDNTQDLADALVANTPNQPTP